MSNSRTELLQQAKHILTIIENAKILKPLTRSLEQNAPIKLDLARELVSRLVSESKLNPPGLITVIATTFLKIGLCQEFANLFLLEYCIKYKKRDVSLIFLNNPAEGHKPEDHMIALIGPIITPDNLIMGRDPNQGCIIDPKNANQPIAEFFSNNSNSVFVDPLLNCFGGLNEGLEPLLAYCSKYKLTHVVGVRCFHKTPNLIERAPMIKQIAYGVATTIAKSFNMTLSPINPTTNYQTSIPLFDNSKIDMLVKKYNLVDDSQTSLEKGLRNAVTKNSIEDVKTFITVVKNINAADANPTVSRTALHWAAFHNHRECYGLLLKAGAANNTLDAESKTALQYLCAHAKHELD